MQTGEYHFVTDSKNALFTDDELGSASIVPNRPKGRDEKWTLEPQACRAQTSSG